MTEPFSVRDKRAARTASSARTASGIHVPGDFNAEMGRLRSRGYSLPNSNFQARLETKKVVTDLKGRGTVTDVQNRAMMQAMRQDRLQRASGRLESGGMTRTGANTQMVLPKVRQPMGSLMDRGIPFQVQDPKEHSELLRWARLFYSTHHLVPLLIDLYSTFPVVGLEFVSKDKKIEEFYESMFMDDLDYENFLPNGLMREYFIAGEVTSLAHFNEQLGIFSSEEILNPDMIRVSKSLFVEQERVQLLVKDLVDSLRNPMGAEESPSEKLERSNQYAELVQHYPEIIQAAMQDDGLDISDALVSRMVNKASWWDLRGTPHLLRSFSTLMLEESLDSAQQAVCDRLYAPLILATLGIEGAMGDGEPWIPEQGELEDLRDDIQSALAADFKLLVHNFGLNVTSVFGRESVPNLTADYERIDANLMQAWGIGQALIMGGSGGAYASSALNREICEQLMKKAQNQVIRHMRKRMLVIAEAQEHYDFELKGGVRKPIYREIVQYNEETGEEEIVRVPKLLIPEVRFASLNLRDESVERSFITQLREFGVPVSDKTLAVNIPFDFKQELQRQSQETIDKGHAQAEAMGVLQEILDEQGLPYPPELSQYLQATLQLRAALAETEMAESQNTMLDQQVSQVSPAGMMGLLPGTMMQPAAPPQEEESASPEPTGGTADPTLGQGAPTVQPPPQQMVATMHGPRMMPPGGEIEEEVEHRGKPEIPRNRQRPEESDEMRKTMPKKARTALPGKGKPERQTHIPELQALNRIHRGPSSYRKSHAANEDRVERAVKRRELMAKSVTVEQLVHDSNFWSIIHADGLRGEIEPDFEEIQAGGAPESRRLLEELLEQYGEVTGTIPRW